MKWCGCYRLIPAGPNCFLIVDKDLLAPPPFGEWLAWPAERSLLFWEAPIIIIIIIIIDIIIIITIIVIAIIVYQFNKLINELFCVTLLFWGCLQGPDADASSRSRIPGSIAPDSNSALILYSK